MAMAVGLIVLLIATSILGQTGEGYERVGGGIGAEREARAVLTQLSSDLGTAPFQNVEVTKGGGKWRGDHLGFLSLQPEEAQSRDGRIGDLCTVCYSLNALPYAGRTVRCLMRGFRESGETFDSLQAGGVTTLYEPQEKDEPVAFGVVSFEARPKSRARPSGDWVDWTQSSGPPEAVEVRLVIARREMTPHLRTSADWSGEGQAGTLLGSPADVASHKGLEVFATTLRLGNHGNR
jgi:hypothetical protein